MKPIGQSDHILNPLLDPGYGLLEHKGQGLVAHPPDGADTRLHGGQRDLTLPMPDRPPTLQKVDQRPHRRLSPGPSIVLQALENPLYLASDDAADNRQPAQLLQEWAKGKPKCQPAENALPGTDRRLQRGEGSDRRQRHALSDQSPASRAWP